MDVWYVSYGSNICEDRFLCYIYGDTPKGSTAKECGCTDKTPPKRSEKVELPYPLYFAKERSKWGDGGVAFIGDRPVYTDRTYARKYLITAEQFSEVVAQENNQPGLLVELQQVLQKGKQTITDGWYGSLLYLGEEDGFPMFTFTANTPMDRTTFNKPSASYLTMIVRGLRELGLTNDEIVSYLLGKKGIAEYFTTDTLGEYIDVV
ncbi:hypothetical protein F3157_16985 [Virgibacillus dakarensis]|uniref:Histone deacetylase n=1 Tax=Lentibacillus populi TaxID=1827502 RepID=A0A9W5TWS6_9BACI|nr:MULTISPECIES: hypothetical protein [Bacillaceae]MBT2214608.1 hypothetical protein [Virgibacillus dakarensis]MTW87335.1 hypothetical protein [Virgibacillus dakarensis]GGB40426.1 hypothetical protein GCM10011409_17440 [Lentibacillus populi]